MKTIKYIICCLLIFLCIGLNGEISVMNLLSGKMDGFTLVTSENTNNYDTALISCINDTAKKSNVDFFFITTEETSLISKEVSFIGTDCAVKQIKQRYKISNGRIKSIIYNNIDIHFSKISGSELPAIYGNFYLTGSQSDIENFIAEVSEKSDVTLKSVTGKNKISDIIALSLPWVFTISIILFFSSFIFSVNQKEIFIKIMFGNSPVKLFLKSAVSDILIYCAFFILGTVILSHLSFTYANIKFTTLMLILLCIFNTAVMTGYLTIDYNDNKRIINIAFNSRTLLRQSYFLKFISVILVSVITTSVAASILPFFKYIKAEKIINKYSDYSFCRINLSHSKSEGIIEIFNKEQITAETIYRQYFNKCNTMMLAKYSNMIYSNLYAYDYLADEFEVLDKADMQKDIYILLPDNLSSTEKENVINTIKENIRMAEGKNFKYSYDVLCYKAGKDILYFNYIQNGSGFNFEHNPYVVYNTIDPSTLSTEELETDRINIGYSFLYKMNDSISGEIIDKFSLSSLNETNISELYYNHLTNMKWSIILLTGLSVYLIITESFLIAFIIKIEYQVYAQEFALKKVFGYTTLEKNKHIIGITLLSDIAAAAINILLCKIFYINLFSDNVFSSSMPAFIPLAVSTFFTAGGLIILTARISRYEQENVPKILKGGAL